MATGAGWAGWSAGPSGRGRESNCKIHGLVGLIHGLKNLGPHQSDTGFYGSMSGFGGP